MLSQAEKRTDITIATAATLLLDEVIKLLNLQNIKVSRNALSRAIILAILERYQQLPSDKRRTFPTPWRVLLKQQQYGVNFKPDLNSDIDKIVDSNVGHQLFLTGRPDILFEGLRSVLSNANESQDIFNIDLEDIKRHLER